MNFQDLDVALQFLEVKPYIVIQHSDYKDRWTLINYVLTKLKAEGHKCHGIEDSALIVNNDKFITFEIVDIKGFSDRVHLLISPIQDRYYIGKAGEVHKPLGAFNPNFYDGIGLEEVDEA